MNNNCFAHDPRQTCQILHDSSGCGDGCPFRKSPAEAEISRQRAYHRLAGLPEARQQYISDTYYQGMRPWRKAVDI